MRNNSLPFGRRPGPRALLLLSFLLLGSAPIKAQNLLEQSKVYTLTDSLLRARQKEAAFGILRAQRADLERRGLLETADFVALLLAEANYNMATRKYEEAVRCNQTAHALHEKIAPRDTLNRISLLDRWADNLRAAGQRRKSVPLSEKSLALRIAVSGENSPSAAEGYYGMALAHSDDEDKAAEFCLKAIRILKNAGRTRDRLFGVYNHTLGLHYFAQERYALALEHLQVALTVQKDTLGEHPTTATCMSLIGSVYDYHGNLEKSLEYQTQAITLFEKLAGPADPIVGFCNLKAAAACNAAAQPRRALGYLHTAQYSGAEPGKPVNADFGLALVYNVAYRLLGDYDRALLYADTALTDLEYEKGADLTKIKYRHYLWHALTAKANALVHLYQRQKQTALLVEADRLLTDAQFVMELIMAGFRSERAQLGAYRDVIKGVDRAIGVHLQFFETTGDIKWLKSAFEQSDKSKGLLLYKQMSESKKLRQTLAPEVLTEEEKELGEQIIAVEKRLFEAGAEAPQTAKDSFQEQIFNLKNRRELLRKQITAVCPDYFNEILSFPAVPFDSLQAAIKPGGGILEFFAGDTSLTAFLLLPDTLIARSLGKKSVVEKDIAQLRDAIGRYFLSPRKNSDLYLQSAREYAESARRLYQALLEPFEARLPQRLVIVPDGPLAHLPFEALLTKTPERPDRFHGHDYWSNTCAISYAYSTALLREMERRPASAQTAEPLLALAPFYDGATAWHDSLLALQTNPNRLDFSPLPFSGEEVYKIARVAGGKTLTGAAATKDAFLRAAPRYRVLHLATHAQANDRAGHYSFLTFAPQNGYPQGERLYVSEIHGLRLNAELAVLSACETGLGQMYRGEGVISVARAFAAAGAHSIVQSQWVVNDAKTRDLMVFFYQNLKKDVPKDLALQEAQKEYLRTFRGEEAHPYFWAGFILIGDVQPLGRF
jgi:CHAT domain-containing protein/tetratricopeptide (TPR) repeat protein